MYQCSQLADAQNGTQACINWVQVGFMGLPDITNADAVLLAGAITALLVTAYIFKLLRNSI
jgi:hypothetical protein